MTVFLIILIAVLFIFVLGAILNKSGAKDSSASSDPDIRDYFEERYKHYLKELHELDDSYHNMLKLWKEFHAKYENLGEPTLRIGYPDYQKPMPWEYPTVHIPYDEIAAEPDPSKRMDMASNGASQMRLDHSIPSIGCCATFWQDERIAVLGREELRPEEIRFVKSNRNNPLKWIEVTVTTTQLDRPTVSVLFEPEFRNQADELKAAVIAFKNLP